MQLSEEAKEAKRIYYREYYKKNKEKYKLNDKRYWEKKGIKENEVTKVGKEKGVVYID